MRVYIVIAVLFSAPVFAAEPKSLFNGKDLTGWEGDDKTWRVEDGAIVGGSLDAVVPRNEFLCTTKTFDHFELKVTFKLLGDKDKANGGVQFRHKAHSEAPRSERLPGGYRPELLGCLYDESRRNKVLAGPKAEDLPKIIKLNEWNEYKIRAEGPHIQLWLNGTKTVDFTETDKTAEQTGIIGLQVHGGGKTKVLYKDILIEELPAPK